MQSTKSQITQGIKLRVIKLTHVNSAKKASCEKYSSRNGQTSVRGLGGLVWLGFCVLFCGVPGLTWAQAEPPEAKTAQPAANNSVASEPSARPDQQAGQQPDQHILGSISGTVLDQSGAPVAGAQVMLIRENQAPNQQIAGDDGQFSFTDIAPGAFQLTFSAAGLAGQTISGVLQSGEGYVAPQISLHVATSLTSVRVEPPPVEVAEMQIKDEEKQRVLAVMPNFYVSYVPDAVPLTPKQKFELASRMVIDPFTFGLTGVVAGAEQAKNRFSDYGQGAQGYGKRFGAAYAGIVSSTFIGSAALPSILKQDPRYFYKGTGTKRSRLFYALANAVICKGDNGQWQPNYSGIAGSLIAGGLSNFYYPKSDRNRVGFVFENTAIGIGETAVLDVLQEFFIRKLTPKPSNQKPSKI
jgi:Carboxypeptidase regulatory-like domain